MPPVSLWLRRIFTDSHFFFALKVLLAMGSLLLAGSWLEQVPAAVTLSLGAMAGALSETDHRPGPRLVQLLLGLLCFFIAITGVTALIDMPWLFGPVLVLATFGLILAGAWGQAAGKLGFGTLLVAIYAMQGHVDSPSFWYQPLLLTAGAAWYGVLSWIMLLIWPYKPVHEQLAQCCFALSRYLLAKSRFFDSPGELHQGLRHQLAQLNIQLVNSLELTKQMLNRRLHHEQPDPELARLLSLYLLVQGMHERAASSHYSYHQLNQALDQAEILAGYQVLLAELGEACYRLGLAILTHRPYRPGKRIGWELSALKDQLDYSHLRHHYSPELMSPLKFLTRNMAHVHDALRQAETLTATAPGEPGLHRANTELARPASQPFGQRLRALFSPNAILFRHGVRLSACLALGYAVITALELERGYWILLTSLFVCQPSFSATRQRLTERTLGTLAGIAAGAPLLWLFPAVESQLVILLVCAFVFFTQVRVHYSWAVCFITLFVLLAFNLQGAERAPILLPRLLDTLAGCALAFVAVWLIWPDWQRRHLPRLLADAMDANAAYLSAICQPVAGAPSEHLAYRIARKQAHLADNQLAQAWQNIRVEPVSRHWLNLCFEIAYRNHTLLSYLSALGAHRRQGQTLPEPFVLELNQRLQAAANALRGNAPLPEQPPLPAMINNGDTEWQILARQLHNNMALLVNDLYQLAGGVRQDAQASQLG